MCMCVRVFAAASALVEGEVCYQFIESDPTASVDRKADCAAGLGCRATGEVGFNSVMECLAAVVLVPEPPCSTDPECMEGSFCSHDNCRPYAVRVGAGGSGLI